jgi:hypothetical protein
MLWSKIMACVKIQTRTHESFCELNSELERTNTITTFVVTAHTLGSSAIH